MPTLNPTAPPTVNPSSNPTTTHPSSSPTAEPTPVPSMNPTLTPSISPTLDPSLNPTFHPMVNATAEPSDRTLSSSTRQSLIVLGTIFSAVFIGSVCFYAIKKCKSSQEKKKNPYPPKDLDSEAISEQPTDPLTTTEMTQQVTETEVTDPFLENKEQP